jgi:hypothetical protein
MAFNNERVEHGMVIRSGSVDGGARITFHEFGTTEQVRKHDLEIDFEKTASGGLAVVVRHRARHGKEKAA